MSDENENKIVIGNENRVPTADDLQLGEFYYGTLPEGTLKTYIGNNPFLFVRVWYSNILTNTFFISEKNIPLIYGMPSEYLTDPAQAGRLMDPNVVRDEINGFLTKVSDQLSALVIPALPENIRVSMEKVKDTLESYQLQNPILNQFVDLTLPTDKNSTVTPISAYDAMLVTLSTGGLILAFSVATPFAIAGSVALMFAGSVGLVDRRGIQAAFAVPVGIVTALTHPTLTIKAVGEVTKTAASVVKDTIDTSTKVIGLLVTTAGVVMGLILNKQ